MTANEMDELIAHYGLSTGSRGELDRLCEAPGPVVLVNHFALREQAAYDTADHEPCSGVEAMMRYAAVSGDPLAAVGGRFLHQGIGAGTLWGVAEPWDLTVVASYPSARAVIDLLHDPAYRQAYVHRRAALRDQRVLVSVPFG